MHHLISKIRELHLNQVCYLAQEYNHYLSRELNWIFVEQQELMNFSALQKKYENATWIFLLGNNLSELKYFNQFARKKFWIYLYGDETFSPIRNFVILRNKYVKGVIRPYPLPKGRYWPTQLKWFRNSLRLLKTKKSIFFKAITLIVYGQVIVSRQFFSKMLHRLFNKRNINSIPGYTNLFAESFLRKFSHQLSNPSLTQIGRSNITETSESRCWPLSFVGQTGNVSRESAIITAKSCQGSKNFKCVTREKFGGTRGSYNASNATADEYLEILFRSKFSLCPGGNYSTATFRFLESIILGAIPIVSLESPTVPGYELPFGDRLIATRRSWFEELSKDLDPALDIWRASALRLTFEAEDFYSKINLAVRE